MSKLNKIQFKLFKNYTTIMIVTISLFMVIFYKYTSTILEERATESLSQLSNTAIQELDMVLAEMNTMQKRVLFAEQAKSLIFTDSKLFETHDYKLQREFNYLATLIYEPQHYKNYQINILNLNGNYAGFGHNYFVKKIDTSKLDNQSLITDILKLDGKKLITPPHVTAWASKGTQIVSLYRSFSENVSDPKPTAIIETQVNYQEIIDIINTNLNKLLSKNTKQIIIYDSNQQLIYPLNNAELSLDHYFASITPSTNTSFILKNENTIDNEKLIIAGTQSDFSGWTVLATEPEDELLAPINALRNTLSLIGLIAVCLTMVINYLLSRKLSNPIRQIHTNMKKLKLDELPIHLPQNMNSGIVEIEGLHHVFVKMCDQLQDSLDAVVAARSLEIQSRLTAMQSQMNPHFIYNTLAIIKIMGKESANKGIVDICTNLSTMLRYVSSSSSSPVLIKDELDYTYNYLNLMKIRFQDNLIYQLNIPEELYNIEIPRLIIQPLVENSIKFATEISPPWLIDIQGTIDHNNWFITVSDNGIGITKQKLVELQKKFSEFNIYRDISNSQINGMGLINIFARLKILYGEEVIFKIEPLPDRGVSITIGGKL